MEKAVIKIKYKNQKAIELVVYYDNQEQLNSIINTLHQDQVNIEYYEVFLDEINNDEEMKGKCIGYEYRKNKRKL